MKPRPWLVSARFDLAFFVGPGLASIAILWLSPAELVARDDLPVWLWLLLIPLVDVSHVYASLYRTYFDGAELGRRPALYAAVPAAVFVVGTITYAADARLFWTLLAYTAVWHFVRQQYGFLALYRRRGGEAPGPDGRIDALLLYASMLYPLVYWHTHLPRKFVWFVEGDFLPVRLAWLSTVAGWAYAAIAVAYLGKEARRWSGGEPFAVGKNLLLLSTAVTWYVGIVAYDSDYSFTVTNVVPHGIPYAALVWIVCRRKWAGARSGWLPWICRPRWVGAFVGILVVFALAEEGLWDLLVWGDHPTVFGGRNQLATIDDSLVLPFVVALLALPQATHYVLDGFIWKSGARNPDLKRLLS
jgi:hypothetical protein